MGCDRGTEGGREEIVEEVGGWEGWRGFPPTRAGRLMGALSDLKSRRFDCVHGRSNYSVMRQFGGW